MRSRCARRLEGGRKGGQRRVEPAADQRDVLGHVLGQPAADVEGAGLEGHVGASPALREPLEAVEPDDLAIGQRRGDQADAVPLVHAALHQDARRQLVGGERVHEGPRAELRDRRRGRELLCVLEDFRGGHVILGDGRRLTLGRRKRGRTEARLPDSGCKSPRARKVSDNYWSS